jgi:hypothetical protein
MSNLPEILGFRNEPFTVHTSRTMMSAELGAVMQVTPSGCTVAESVRLIVEDNILGKATKSTREKTAKLLCQLYTLDPQVTIFRIFRQLWDADSVGHPMLAALLAHARDSLLRRTYQTVKGFRYDEVVPLDAFMQQIMEVYPGRFSPKMLLSAAQNVASSYEQSGHLAGRKVKKRSKPVVTPAVAAYAMFLGYVCGLRGQGLFTSYWAKLLDANSDSIATLVAQAHRFGWLDYRSLGSVIDISFQKMLTPKEKDALHEQS